MPVIPSPFHIERVTGSVNAERRLQTQTDIIKGKADSFHNFLADLLIIICRIFEGKCSSLTNKSVPDDDLSASKPTKTMIKLDDIARRKLVLVKQIYQRALILAQAKHSPADRIFAVVAFDLANETVLKAVVSGLDSRRKPADDFQAIFNQAESEMAKKSLTIPDRNKIQHVRTIRNDAQHRAKYPSDADVNDCRTYTRDFLAQTFLDVWEESFESISLIDAIQKDKLKNYLNDAQKDLVKNNYEQTTIKSVIAFTQASNNIADGMTETINPFVSQIMIGGVFSKAEPSDELFRAFVRTRQLVVFQSIGINTQEYLKYIRLTRFVYTDVREDGSYDYNFGSSHIFTKDEAEFILNFVTNSILIIESVDEDAISAYNYYS